MRKFWKAVDELYDWLLIILFCLLMLIGLWCVYDNYYVYSHTLNDSLLKYKPGQSNSVDPEDSPISDDMVAWLTIDGTNIDYPIMQGYDNSKYLNTDPFGGYSLSGSIFLDFRNAPNFSDDYSLIYGHHMEYGKMFGALDDFLNESYLNNHSTGTLIIGKNAEMTYQVKVFASMRAKSNVSIVFDLQQEQIRQYIKDNATIYTADQDDRIIGLSTCAEGDSISRIVVFCYIIE